MKNTYLVAVSGGVDSVVLLDMLAKSNKHRLIVAHVDHGIRVESDADERFVRALAKRYNIPYVTKRFEMGSHASEDTARTLRYGFLFEQAKKYHATIVTAHHQDDMIETMAINYIRGTGWRGLVVLGRKGIKRPLLAMRKQDIYEYAIRNNLEWVEDETNSTDAYLRNKVRKKTATISTQDRRRLVEIRAQQQQIAREVLKCTQQLTKLFSNKRYPYIMVDSMTAMEALREYMAHSNIHLDRPTLYKILHIIKTARPNTRHDVKGGVVLLCNIDNFIVEVANR